MKTYEPRRNNECPNGLHADYDPAKDPTQNECTCPWLIIQSSTPVQHLTSWNRRETENVIREMDRGYFDPPGYPKRTGSMFLSPTMQRLLDVAEKEPVAAALALLAGSGSGLPPFDAIAWDAEDAVLSVRIGGGGWWHLFLGKSNVEAVTNHDDAHAAGANPVLLWADHPDTARETGLTGFYPRPEEASSDVYTEDLVDFDSNGELPGGAPIFAETAAVVPIPQVKYATGGAVSGTTVTVGDGVPPGLVVPQVTGSHLPQRVPQVPSGIAEAGHGDDYCTCDLNLRYTCPTCRAAQDDTPITITRGGVQFPIDVPEDVFRAAQVAEHPNDYEIPPLCLNPWHHDAHTPCRRTEGHEGMHRNGGTQWGIL